MKGQKEEGGGRGSRGGGGGGAALTVGMEPQGGGVQDGGPGGAVMSSGLIHRLGRVEGTSWGRSRSGVRPTSWQTSQRLRRRSPSHLRLPAAAPPPGRGSAGHSPAAPPATGGPGRADRTGPGPGGGRRPRVCSSQRPRCKPDKRETLREKERKVPAGGSSSSESFLLLCSLLTSAQAFSTAKVSMVAVASLNS